MILLLQLRTRKAGTQPCFAGSWILENFTFIQSKATAGKALSLSLSWKHSHSSRARPQRRTACMNLWPAHGATPLSSAPGHVCQQSGRGVAIPDPYHNISSQKVAGCGFIMIFHPILYSHMPCIHSKPYETARAALHALRGNTQH